MSRGSPPGSSGIGRAETGHVYMGFYMGEWKSGRQDEVTENDRRQQVVDLEYKCI